MVRISIGPLRDKLYWEQEQLHTSTGFYAIIDQKRRSPCFFLFFPLFRDWYLRLFEPQNLRNISDRVSPEADVVNSKNQWNTESPWLGCKYDDTGRIVKVKIWVPEKIHVRDPVPGFVCLFVYLFICLFVCVETFWRCFFSFLFFMSRARAWGLGSSYCLELYVQIHVCRVGISGPQLQAKTLAY